MGKRKDDDTDRDVWLYVTRTIKAYAPTARKENETPPPQARKNHAPIRQASPALPPPSLSHTLSSARGFDSATERKLKRGQLETEGRLDLHGLSRLAAQETLARFIAGAVRQEQRTILVVTGKSGVLRRLVPEWLNDMPGLVLAYTPARPKDGGDGALYIRLRRKRRSN
jgi:DNA-nicking Smr family endonuclease